MVHWISKSRVTYWSSSTSTDQTLPSKAHLVLITAFVPDIEYSPFSHIDWIPLYRAELSWNVADIWVSASTSHDPFAVISQKLFVVLFSISHSPSAVLKKCGVWGIVWPPVTHFNESHLIFPLNYIHHIV